MTYREQIEALVSSFEQQARQAFLEAVDEIRNAITLKVVVERLERGDVSGAIEAMQIDERAFERLERVLEEAYIGGGTAETANLPALRDPSGARLVLRFGTRNTPGEAELRQHSSQLVTRITEDQRQAVREGLEAGLARGDNPWRTALDVIGRKDRVTNRRTGGIIGLTREQARWVENARQELLSGDPVKLREYLERGRRDKRSDRTITKAIREGKALDRATVDKIVGRYADGLLLLRGETVALNETLGALSRGRDDAINQQMTAGLFEAQDVTKTWRSAKDRRVRHTHRMLDGQTVAKDQAFMSESGAMIRYPHDPQAPASETILCRCWMTYSIDYIAAAARRYRAEAA